MKSSTHDRTTGKIHEVKGTIRQTAGKLTGNLAMEVEGAVEKALGKVQTVVGKIEKSVGA